MPHFGALDEQRVLAHGAEPGPLGVLALEGEEGFGGPRELYERLFGPLLSVHIVLVTLGLAMAIFESMLASRMAPASSS